MTLAESVLALSALFMATGFILPFCMNVLIETAWRSEQQEGMRKLYEEAEARMLEEPSFVYKLEQSNFEGNLIWETENGKHKACVSIQKKTRCVVEQ